VYQKKELDNLNNLGDIKQDIKSDIQIFPNNHTCKYIENFQEPATKLNILSFNIRSLNKNIDELRTIREVENKLYDCIALQEVWNIKENTINLKIDGYIGPITKNREKQNGGGVAFYIKSGTDFNIVDDLTYIQPDEIEVLTIKIKISCTSHFITSLYRPPRNTKLQKFYENLENLVNKKNAIDKNATYDILGDFNINLFNSKLREDFFENSLCNGLLPIITRPTRITENTGSLIDNILTNDPTNTQCYIMPSTISDHFHLILSRATIKQNSKTLESQYRPISDENIECLKEQLSNFNWNTILSSNDPYYVSDQFLKTIQTSFENACPVKKQKKGSRIHNVPGLTKS